MKEWKQAGLKFNIMETGQKSNIDYIARLALCSLLRAGRKAYNLAPDLAPPFIGAPLDLLSGGT